MDETNVKRNIFTICVLLVSVLFGWWYWEVRHKELPENGTEIANVNFSCNEGKTIGAVFYQGEKPPAPAPGEPPTPRGSVRVVLSDGRTMLLPETLSADGARYANKDESFVFWNKGKSAFILENNEAKNYTGCIVVMPQPAGSNLSQVYSSGANSFSLRYPEGYTVDESHKYELSPSKIFSGVEFTIPAAVADGTNLGHDTYLSVETMPITNSCKATLFLDHGSLVTESARNGISYSVATSMGAGAGNRYEETVYSTLTAFRCIAVRYYVHYTVVENYPPGMIREFNKKALLAQFDQIRNTLVID